MPNSAAQYDSHEVKPRGSQTWAACASRTRAASTVTERRTSSIASRSPAVTSRACVVVSSGRVGSTTSSWSSLCSPMAPSSSAPMDPTRAYGMTSAR
ncbi:hypothetical protein ACFYWO_40075 [Streptomyces sp. NPDC002932]|uniref:hypothetical protein n=1 Tax=Streptomyces sp. NPDC002932 TaxID=3364672 RepID=UPI003677F07C